MLARLEAIDGVTSAEVDHRGELLRLGVRDRQAVSDVVAILREIGYGADELSGPTSVDRWYDRDRVADLSREEGRVIAERVVHPFARSRGLDGTTAARLEDAVAVALGGYFASHSIDRSSPPGALRVESIDVAEAAATAVVGPGAARELTRVLRSDLEGADRP